MSAASTAQDSTIAAIRRHHQELFDRLADLVDAIDLAAEDGEADAEALALFSWYRSALLPHFKAADATLYVRGRERESTALVVKALHTVDGNTRVRIEDLDAVDGPIEAVAAAASAKTLVAAHIQLIDELLLPALAAAGVDLDDAVRDQHDLIGGERTRPAAVAKVPTHDGDEAPTIAPISGTEELDVRALSHQARHGVILGKMQALTDTGALVLINDHDPKPLRYQADAFWPGQFEWTYLEEGPEAWRVSISRA